MNNDIKKNVEFNLIEVIIIILITGIIVSITSGLIVYNNYDKLSKVDETVKENNESDLKEFKESYNHIINSYVKQVDKKKLLDAAIKGMYDFLNDEYSIYMEKDQSQILDERLDGSYTGIGVEITMNENKEIIVNKVFDSSPAMSAGIKKGDILLKIDNEELKGKDTQYFSDTIKNNKKDTFLVTYKRNNIEYEVTIKRKIVNIDSVEYKKYDNVAYIKIDSFSSNTHDQLKEKILSFEKNINSIVIDLRGNTGGYLESAYSISDLFIEKGKVIYQLKDKDENIKKFTANEGVLRSFKKIVVLVDQFSASASEILALALKESASATIVGVKTYGKGTVQEKTTLSSGALVKYTSAYWLSPKGNSIDKVGIIPDKEEKDIQKQLDTALNLAK